MILSMSERDEFIKMIHSNIEKLNDKISNYVDGVLRLNNIDENEITNIRETLLYMTDLCELDISFAICEKVNKSIGKEKNTCL